MLSPVHQPYGRGHVRGRAGPRERLALDVDPNPLFLRVACASHPANSPIRDREWCHGAGHDRRLGRTGYWRKSLTTPPRSSRPTPTAAPTTSSSRRPPLAKAMATLSASIASACPKTCRRRNNSMRPARCTPGMTAWIRSASPVPRATASRSKGRGSNEVNVRKKCPEVANADAAAGEPVHAEEPSRRGSAPRCQRHDHDLDQVPALGRRGWRRHAVTPSISRWR